MNSLPMTDNATGVTEYPATAEHSPVPEGDGLREVVADLVNNYRDQLPSLIVLGLEVALASPAPVKAEAEVVALTGGEIWEFLFGDLKGDVPDELTDEALDRLATHIRTHFIATPSSGGRREALEVDNAMVSRAMDSLFGEYTSPGNDEAWIDPDWMTAKSKVREALVRALANTNPTGAE